MNSAQENTRLISDVLEHLARQALDGNGKADVAVECFSAAVDRLMTWLPLEYKAVTLELARAHRDE